MKTITIKGQPVYRLAKGENPYQIPAALFSTVTRDPLSLDKFKLVSGDPPGFTNLCGLDRLVQTLCRTAHAFKLKYQKIPYIVIAAKHGNPCGMSVDWQKPETAVNKALFGNPVAIWGGEVIANFKITDNLAPLFHSSQKRKKLLNSSAWMLDLITAPGFSTKAIELLGARAKRKLFVNPALLKPSLNPASWTYRFTRGSLLRQPPPNCVLDFKETAFAGSKKGLTPDFYDSLIIAWTVAFNSMHGGNEVAFAKDRALVSCGGGPSTIEAAQLALFKAKNQKHPVVKTVFAADAFFPFTDVPEFLIQAGVIAGLVPAGGQAFKDVKAYFKKNNVPMFYLDENFRGFCYH
jgi:phosphoribosylaminoimidazolecarboxamide formyltransferase/IMP cyclohydrolase